MLKTPGLLVSVGLAAVLALLVSCGQGSEPGNNRAEETTGDFGLRPPGTPVIIADPRYATLNGSSVGTLAAAYPWVVVGVVTGVSDPFDPRPGYLGQPTPEPAPASDPKADATLDPEALSRPPGHLSTSYTVRVLTAIISPTSPVPETIEFTQGGGVWEGIAYEIRDDPLVEVGQTYLFFLAKDPEVLDFTGPPFGRFAVNTSGTLEQVADEWCYLPAVQSVAGLKVEEAKVKVPAAIAGTELAATGACAASPG